MKIDQVKATSDIHNMSDEDFANLDISALTAKADKDITEDEDLDNPDHDQDNPDKEDEENPEESESEDEEGEKESESEEETPEEDNEDESEQSDEDSDGKDPETVKVDNAPTKKPKVDKAKPKAEKDNADDSESVANFYKEITAPLKAAGQEFNLTDPNQIRELVSKGIDYTRKMQDISYLRGIGEVLRENGLLDAEKIAYVVDLVNHKPEAIARLIKESGVDTYELDDEKAEAYQAVPVNVESQSKKVAVRDIVEQYKDDAKFNAMFQEARTWDEASQTVLVDHPHMLQLLAQHANNGVYDTVMAKVKQERALNGVSEPILQHYNRIGQAMYPTSTNDGGQAQAPKKEVQAKERVVIKRKKVDEDARRKSLAPTAATPKKKGGLKVTSRADIFNLSDEEFEKLDPNILRKFS